MTRGAVSGLVLILGAAAALRFVGIEFGLPLRLRPDETIILDGVRELSRRDDWRPPTYAYPGLAFVVPLGVLRATHALEPLWRGGATRRTFDAFLDDRRAPLRVLRTLSSILSIATVAVTFLIGRDAGGTRLGLSAAALLATAFLAVRDAHFATTDAPAAFLVAVATLLTVHAARRGRVTAFVGLGAAIGAAAAWKYLPAMLLVPAGVAAWTSRAGGGAARAAGLWAIASATAVAAFLLSAPYSILDLDGFLAGFVDQAGRSFGDGVAPRGGIGWLLWFAFPVAVGWPVLVAAVVGALPDRMRPLPRVVLLSLVAATTVVLAVMPRVFLRYVLPVLPAVCVLAAAGAARVAAMTSRPALAAGVITGVLAVEPLARSLALDRLFATPSTLEETLAVIDASHLEPCAPYARSLGTDRWRPLRPIDPLSWTDGADRLVILSRHPHPVVGDEWTRFRPAFDGRAAASILFETVVRRGGATFEEADWFLYPVAGFQSVEKAGPDVVVFRVRGAGRSPTSAIPCGPPEVTYDPSIRTFRIVRPQGAKCAAIADYAMVRALGAGAEASWVGPILCDVQHDGVVVPKSIAPGAYSVAFAFATLEGLSAWSTPIAVDL